MKIEPTYVTFEQAKLLKEKGFTKENGCACREGWINYLFYFEGKTSEPENDSGYALDTLGNSHLIERPEQWQVVEWLRVNHGIWIDVTLSSDSKFLNLIRDIKNPNTHLGIARVNDISFFSSPQEAYSAAFNYILTNNLI
jgi:hypothetical protein